MDPEPECVGCMGALIPDGRRSKLVRPGGMLVSPSGDRPKPSCRGVGVVSGAQRRAVSDMCEELSALVPEAMELEEPDRAFLKLGGRRSMLLPMGLELFELEEGRRSWPSVLSAHIGWFPRIGHTVEAGRTRLRCPVWRSEPNHLWRLALGVCLVHLDDRIDEMLLFLWLLGRPLIPADRHGQSEFERLGRELNIRDRAVAKLSCDPILDIDLFIVLADIILDLH